jgi:hypothetical protein
MAAETYGRGAPDSHLAPFTGQAREKSRGPALAIPVYEHRSLESLARAYHAAAHAIDCGMDDDSESIDCARGQALARLMTERTGSIEGIGIKLRALQDDLSRIVRRLAHDPDVVDLLAWLGCLQADVAWAGYIERDAAQAVAS